MSITYSVGRFETQEIHTSEGTTPSELHEAIVEKKRTAPRSIFVYVPELNLANLLPTILSERLKFHHYLNNEYVYYFWNRTDVEDKVPEYATAIEGIAALILSPDNTEVLLVWEYSNWKPVTGAVHSGDSTIDTLSREVWEEVGLELDPTFKLKCVGGWNYTRARFNTISDNLSCYVVRVKSKDFRVDGFEIKEARWFPVECLVELNYYRKIWDNNDDWLSDSFAIPDNYKYLKMPPERNAFAYYIVSWLWNYSYNFYFCAYPAGNGKYLIS